VHIMELTRENQCVVVGLPAMVSDFVELFGQTRPVLYYDTTFCLGDFYVSTRMVACDACDRWHHVRCVADSYIGKSDPWFCSACK